MGGNVAVLDIQDRPVPGFEQLAPRYNAKAHYFKANVVDQASLTEGFNKALAALGHIDGCIPAPGVVIDKPFVDQTWEELTRIQEINVRGTFFIVQLIVKQLIEQGTPGSIVLLASQCSHIALPGLRMAADNASKGAILMLAKALGVELAKHNIRVNSISPGFVDSDMMQAVRATNNKREGDQVILAPPLKRLSTQNDLTPALVYLLSDASRHITATDLLITGGLHAGTIDGVISHES
ncbi:unnamed protein product [Clonostachys rhizophaga]|uniref:Uncharacterized protein n=1 Tax=Clonostachys rhizophaga TaxID=160324 RepID=A0A9N9VJA7_9HYPO|nr:unnamed protein product [Clonostachys rhizophaga]